MSKWLLGLTSLALGTLVSQLAISSEPAHFVPGELIVKFKPGVNVAHYLKEAKLVDDGITLKRTINLSTEHLFVINIGNDKSLQSAIAKLKLMKNVVYAEPNYLYHTAVMPKQSVTSYKKILKSPFANITSSQPDDPSFSRLWGLSNTGSNEPQGKVGVEGADINALNAWDISQGSGNIKIAIIDTGIDYNHPDLKANVDSAHGYNFINDTKDAMDDNGHGTHCAGTIGATHDNKIGVAGVMANVTLIPLKFLDSNGSGTLESAIKAIDYASTLNVDLMSNSWGGSGRSQAMYEAIKRASEKGIIFTAAAGNSSTDNDRDPSYPANYEVPNIISVAALTAQNDLAYFSSYGKNTVHIAAPGRNILSTAKGGGYEIMSGTSMATPHVSGALGLLLAKEGRLPLDVLKERLTMTGVPVKALKGKTQTASRLDAYNLLTDTRADRSGPKNNAWKTVQLTDAFESAHPYKENSNVSKSYTFPGAKYVRVIVAKYELETGYDYVRIADGAGVTSEKISGSGTYYTSDFIEGDTVQLNFVSDRSINKWGYQISEVQVQ